MFLYLEEPILYKSPIFTCSYQDPTYISNCTFKPICIPIYPSFLLVRNIHALRYKKKQNLWQIYPFWRTCRLDFIKFTFTNKNSSIMAGTSEAMLSWNKHINSCKTTNYWVGLFSSGKILINIFSSSFFILANKVHRLSALELNFFIYFIIFVLFLNL